MILKKKTIILSMDVEDWYHLDYFHNHKCDTSYSLMDGLDVYSEMLSRRNLPSSFFVLGNLVESIAHRLQQLASDGHDISSHGSNHIRPMSMSLSDFSAEAEHNFNLLTSLLRVTSVGYRAPCFSLDRERLNIIKDIGYAYDSSRIDFGFHPLYGSIDMLGYQTIEKNIYIKDKFLEFEVSTLKFFNRTIPVSGGGYLRILPWRLMRFLIKQYLKDNSIFVLYIHPFELSRRVNLPLPDSIGPINNFRFSYGRNSTANRLSSLIDLFIDDGFEFTTFMDLRKKILNCDISTPI